MNRTAAVVIDMINPYGHADAGRLVDSVRTVLPRSRTSTATWPRSPSA